MRDVKYQLENFSIYDKAAIEEKVAKMALQGWLVQKPGNLIWKYRRIEPQKLQIAVTYFPNASEFDPSPTEGQQMMEEFASKDSWNIAARWGQMQIFYSEEPEPTPIETDALIQVQTIHRAMRKNMLPTHFFMLALCIFEFLFSGWQFINDPVDFLSTPTSLYLVPMWIFVALSVLWELILYLSWYRKAKAMADESGLFLNLRKNHTLSWIMFLASMILIICMALSSKPGLYGTIFWLIALIIITILVFGVKEYLKEEGTSRELNRFITLLTTFLLTIGLCVIMIFGILEYDLMGDKDAVGTYDFHGWVRNIYDDPMPLVVEDMIEAGSKWSKEATCTETILLSCSEYQQYTLSPEESPVNGMDYTIIDIKWEGLYDLCKNSILNNHISHELKDVYTPIDATYWNANEAYRLYWEDSPLNTYLICWDGRIIEFEFSWEPTPEQIAIATTKLNTK